MCRRDKWWLWWKMVEGISRYFVYREGGWGRYFRADSNFLLLHHWFPRLHSLLYHQLPNDVISHREACTSASLWLETGIHVGLDSTRTLASFNLDASSLHGELEHDYDNPHYNFAPLTFCSSTQLRTPLRPFQSNIADQGYDDVQLRDEFDITSSSQLVHCDPSR